MKNFLLILIVITLCVASGGMAAKKSPPKARAGSPAVSAPQEIRPEGTNGGAMLLIPAGEFTRGCNPAVDYKKCADEFRSATPINKTYLDAYYIDKYEVTVDQYAECVRDGACGEPGVHNDDTAFNNWNQFCNWGTTDRGNHPINCVCWEYADAYCKWAGKRLPTEAEWEKAARGTDLRKYPWGNQPHPSCAVAVVRGNEGYGCGKKSTWPVGSMPKDKSPYGVMDMQGGVSEWTSDLYGQYYYSFTPARNPTGVLLSRSHTSRGSNLFDPPGPNPLYTRVGFESSPTEWRFYFGMRCTKTP